MGRTDYWEKFESHDWRLGIRKLKEKAYFDYGNDPYNGTITTLSSINFHQPSKKFKNHEEVLDYIEERMNRIEEGEVMSIGISGYTLAKPVVKPFTGNLPCDMSIFKKYPDPAALFSEDGCFRMAGPLETLKKVAKDGVMREKFMKDYIILRRNGSHLRVTGEGRIVKTTKQVSSKTMLVLPIYTFIVYGWVRT